MALRGRGKTGACDPADSCATQDVRTLHRRIAGQGRVRHSRRHATITAPYHPYPQSQRQRRGNVTTESNFPAPSATSVPWYLQRVYWWAYVDPRAVTVFERQWLVNLIVWGNFGRLREAALDALGEQLPGKTLQIACVYGDLTRRLAQRIAPGGSLDVVDVLPIQLSNLARKLPEGHSVNLQHGDSTRLAYETGHFDRALLFFLLHEQPAAARRATIEQALRVVRPGGRIVIVDYH